MRPATRALGIQWAFHAVQCQGGPLLGYLTGRTLLHRKEPRFSAKNSGKTDLSVENPPGNRATGRFFPCIPGVLCFFALLFFDNGRLIVQRYMFRTDTITSRLRTRRI